MGNEQGFATKGGTPFGYLSFGAAHPEEAGRTSFLGIFGVCLEFALPQWEPTGVCEIIVAETVRFHGFWGSGPPQTI